MSERLTKVEVDCATGITKIVPLTRAEIAEMEERAAAWRAEQAAQVEAAAAANDAREAALAKLAELGLTDEEIAALLA
jgi:hypothetical protein